MCEVGPRGRSLRQTTLSFRRVAPVVPDNEDNQREEHSGQGDSMLNQDTEGQQLLCVDTEAGIKFYKYYPCICLYLARPKYNRVWPVVNLHPLPQVNFSFAYRSIGEGLSGPKLS